MKRSDHCEGGYCQLRWSVLLLYGMTLSLFHGDQFGQSNLCGMIWLSSHPVIYDISCRVAQPCQLACRNVTQKVFDRHICCDVGRRQTNFTAGVMALHCNGKGLWFSKIDLMVSALVPSQLLKVVAQSPILVRGLLLPCMAYAILMRLVVAWYNVHGHPSSWQDARCRLAWCTRPIALVVRGSSLYSASCHPWQGVHRHLLWREARCGPPQRMRPPLTYSPYLPSVTYMTSLVYSMYWP